MAEPTPELVPDTKDWTWVLERPCPDCGLDASAMDLSALGALLGDSSTSYAQALRSTPEVGVRPEPATWSVLEYACHVRDVHRVFAGRVRSMLEQDTPVFENWDQDRAAVQGEYSSQDPSVVAHELAVAADVVADLYAGVAPEQQARRGVRSNGSEFTVLTLAQYHLHDVVHHLHDIGWDARSATVHAYDAHAEAYAEATRAAPREVLDLIARFATGLPPGASVLEIGSASGRDAGLLEEAGLRVRRTDISLGFVTLMRERGYPADQLDPAVDELGGPWDGVWASACLLHVPREDLVHVLSRLAGATREGGLLHVSLKEGDGEEWSVHGSVAAPRRFVYWREEALRAALGAAGWRTVGIGHSLGRGEDRWLDVIATRGGTGAS